MLDWQPVERLEKWLEQVRVQWRDESDSMYVVRAGEAGLAVRVDGS